MGNLGFEIIYYTVRYPMGIRDFYHISSWIDLLIISLAITALRVAVHSRGVEEEEEEGKGPVEYPPEGT